MNQTKIYTTRKLEKVTKESIAEDNDKDTEYLGAWTATLFYVSHKKCWLIINKLTKYLLILPDVKKSDLKNIETIFKETLYSQLIYDGIITEFELIEKIIGGIALCETNNDRSVSGSLNNCLPYLEDWNYEFRDFENMPFRDLNNRLNSSPNKMLNWQYPKERMSELLTTYAQNPI
ncbi:hypothetical protein ESY86_19075 [Subsaximicrobium wynnwilliamsii]|uniref:DUF6933 domain-containing protein n=1 Tax=Subsaximicrobium wynnwilliamsii TaxID=291179 RepID=A0A5C6ZCS0_9FLAO|nr:hypothetical protein [Subsaximicrobium wynnwilliamsii]TXD81122.1 hypothetical protein ESY87_19275 [Subsaximicrobium wynnwilliamsii]TXD86859.1 hypothetical protein ESY86_19075 [Subsaximicrobium wynnwilliamsii]TXE00450.1 hypothetical protein ESY88_19260 [Subsaximicrobium wynnwilliamsii]